MIAVFIPARCRKARRDRAEAMECAGFADVTPRSGKCKDDGDLFRIRGTEVGWNHV